LTQSHPRLQMKVLKYRTKDIVHKMRTAGPSILLHKTLSYDAVVILVRQPHVIKVSKSFLCRVVYLCNLRHGCPLEAPHFNNNIKVFLTAFMITYKPTHSFEVMGRLEWALLAEANKLMRCFEWIRQAMIAASAKSFSFADVPHDYTENFLPSFIQYIKVFKEWKAQDEPRMAYRLKLQLRNMYQVQVFVFRFGPQYTSNDGICRPWTPMMTRRSSGARLTRSARIWR